ncbi:hypothetical protein L9F63_021411 [Diploptera punctata]|uniref:Peptidase M16C associated domain-containing protein n=1 Tax=Diploptera punctata TaxID=6984 RepID=A0AAD8EBY9_DIPPU|nr:hypothetical protein L9F63_021411 [Diploptera punctata]
MKSSVEDGKHTSVPSEKRWSEPKRKHITCRPDPLAADPNKQSTIAVSQLCSDIVNVQETFELQVLSQLLVRGPNAAFYKTLIEPNIGAGFAPVTGYDSQTKDTVFAVGLQGVSSSDFDKFLELYDKTLSDVVDHGFDKEHVEGVLHGIELNIKHQSADFGLGLLFGIMPLWNHDGDLVKALRVEEQVATLRRNMKENPRYLQEKAEALKDGTHRLILTMSPEDNYDTKLAETEEKLLRSKLATLSPADKENVYRDGIKLREQQEKQEDISCLPTLHMSDLKKEIDITPMTELEFSSIPVQVCVQPTNGMTYLRVIINTSELSDELKELLPLFCQVVTKMGTKKHSFRELDQLAKLKTGGLSVSSHIADDTMEHFCFEDGVLFATYCLDRNIKDMFGLWAEIFNEVSLMDLKRFETLVRMCAAGLANTVADMGHHYAISSAGSLVSPSGQRKETASGLSYVGRMKEIAQLADLSPVLDKMNKISKLILNKTHMRCALNFSPENQENILKQMECFINSVPGIPHVPLVKTRDVEFYLTKKPTRSLHHVHQIPINFAAKSISTVYYCHSHFASLRVMARLLTSKYLHPQIREKGGAYGSGLSLSPSGVLNFYSYRDPSSTATFDVFDKSNEWIRENKFSEQDIEEAKLGVFQSVDAPIPPGSKGMNRFLHGIDDLLLQMHRTALMTVTRDDILEVSELYLGEKSESMCARALVGPENPALQDRKSENWSLAKC